MILALLFFLAVVGLIQCLVLALQLLTQQRLLEVLCSLNNTVVEASVTLRVLRQTVERGAHDLRTWQDEEEAP